MAFQDQVKAWFITGAFPTQAQFWQKFAWHRWKDEPIDITEVTGLQSILNQLSQPMQEFTKQGAGAVDFTYLLPAGFCLEKIIIFPGFDSISTLKVDGVARLEDELITAADGCFWDLNIVAQVDREIIITGLADHAIIKIFKLKITL